MKMIKRIKNICRKIGYLFAFGLKGANDEILSQDNNNSDIGIIQNAETHGMAQSLLKGEVTQEVEELRFRNYLIAKESKNYSYIGNGQTIKKKRLNSQRKVYKFVQRNELICEGIEHELQRINKYDIERYVFDIVYSDITKYRIESFISYGEFFVNGQEISVNFVFDKNLKNKYDPISYGILKELDKISKFVNSYEIMTNDICTNIKMLNFTTYKSYGEDDLIQYSINDLQFVSCENLNDTFILKYKTNNFIRLDLTEKFFSKTMAEKYQTNAPKDTSLHFDDNNTAYCYLCGSKMNKYDADITMHDYGYPICKNCLEKNA